MTKQIFNNGCKLACRKKDRPRTSPQSCNINSWTEKIHTMDRYARRHQTYEMALLCEDECVTLAFETDLRKV